MIKRLSGRSKLVLLLLTLSALFVVIAYVSQRESEELVALGTRSSFNTNSEGVKALYLLLQRQAFSLRRLEAPLTRLKPSDKLLILIEPFVKQVNEKEITALKRWVEAGGTVLYLVDGPARPVDKKDPLFGDVAVVPGNSSPVDMAPLEPNSPLFSGIQKMHFQSPVRLLVSSGSHYLILFADERGSLGISRSLGKGQLIAVAGGVGATNASIREADNALFLVNVASVSTGKEGNIVFDEYHHGVGAASHVSEDGRWQATPFGLQLLCMHLILLALILIYNGNRRFGPYTRLPDIKSVTSSDYMTALAHLYRGASASDAAVASLARDLRRLLINRLDLEPESPDAQLAEASSRIGLNPLQVHAVLQNCQKAEVGGRLSERELVLLAKQIDTMKRSRELVG